MVVMVFDATYEKTTACAVGGMNLAGVFPFLPPLLLGGRHGTAAFDLFHDPIALVVMYGAAACGWLLVALLPLAIHAIDKAQAAQAISRLKEQQRRLVEEWGPEVSGRRPSYAGQPATPRLTSRGPSVSEALLDHRVPDRLLQLLEGADLDLADPLARDAVALAEVLQASSDCPSAAARTESAARARSAPHRALRADCAGCAVPRSWPAGLPDPRPDRPASPAIRRRPPRAAARSATYRDCRCAGSSERRPPSETFSRVAMVRDVLGRQVAVLDRLHLPLQLAQVEEQLLLRRRRPHLHQ